MSNVSLEHEAPLEVLREHPEAVLDLLRVAGLSVDSSRGPLHVSAIDSELSDAQPATRRADMVLAIQTETGRPILQVIVEVQRQVASRPSPTLT